MGSPFREHEDDCSVFIELGRAASKRYNFGATKAFKGLLQEFLRARTAPVIERAAVGILLRLNNGNAAVKSAFFRAPGCQTPDLPLMPKVLPPFGPDRVALSHRFNHAGIWPGTLSLSINNTQAHATVGLEEVRMLEAERHRLILKLLGERSVVSIADFVEFLSVSEATVRRDILDLADAGHIRRIRGGAEALTPRHATHLAGVPFALNQEVCTEQKRAIARAAAELVRDGDSILINGGTTTFGMVEFLTERNLDILTNSVPIVTKLLATSRNRVTLPGGTIYPEQNIVLSPYESDAIEHFWGKRLFTGCFGLNKFGLMEADPLIVQAELKLLKRCEEVVVLADSRKLRQRSAMIVTDLSRLSTLITDRGATEEELKPLQDAGVRVIQVEFDAGESGESGAMGSLPRLAKHA